MENDIEFQNMLLGFGKRYRVLEHNIRIWKMLSSLIKDKGE